MGSPLGPLMVNIFMCHLEEKLTRDGLMPHLYSDDTLARMPNTDAATVSYYPEWPTSQSIEHDGASC